MEEEKQEESTVEVKAEEAVPAEEDRTEAADEEKEGPETVKLREELETVKGQLLRMEHERYLLSRGVPEEDLDYCVFRIGKMVSAEKDFHAAAKEFLKQHGTAHRAPAPRSTGASLAGRASGPRSTNDTMNRILRGV